MALFDSEAELPICDSCVWVGFRGRGRRTWSAPFDETSAAVDAMMPEEGTPADEPALYAGLFGDDIVQCWRCRGASCRALCTQPSGWTYAVVQPGDEALFWRGKTRCPSIGVMTGAREPMLATPRAIRRCQSSAIPDGTQQPLGEEEEEEEKGGGLMSADAFLRKKMERFRPVANGPTAMGLARPRSDTD